MLGVGPRNNGALTREARIESPVQCMQRHVVVGGSSFAGQGLPSGRLGWHRRALTILEGRPRAAHRDIATLYHNLGGIEHARSRFDVAEPLARKGLALRLAQQGPDHPAAAADMVALGAILEGLAKHDEAASLYVRSLAIFEQRLGPTHAEVGATFNNLGALYTVTGAFARAEVTLARALAIRERRKGESHPDVAVTLNNLGVLFKQQRQSERALNKACGAARARAHCGRGARQRRHAR